MSSIPGWDMGVVDFILRSVPQWGRGFALPRSSIQGSNGFPMLSRFQWLSIPGQLIMSSSHSPIFTILSYNCKFYYSNAISTPVMRSLFSIANYMSIPVGYISNHLRILDESPPAYEDFDKYPRLSKFPTTVKQTIPVKPCTQQPQQFSQLDFDQFVNSSTVSWIGPYPKPQAY
ncbi:hypothetical protein MN116_002670 [Schistosoma mekongi]|uniref:Uncharacterized protein n=1 Tax=Schistosoma mekongi TaxID=38744 RepID=A0AAE1ZF67_SCHME|nr:hypothetical protein MN116_002670 [Schistosoma mekongi]